jgi:hypothetical protein
MLYFLFDDQTVRPIGNWTQVVELCILSMYQPVLLLYELANTTTNASYIQLPDYSKVTDMIQILPSSAHCQPQSPPQIENKVINTNPNTSVSTSNMEPEPSYHIITPPISVASSEPTTIRNVETKLSPKNHIVNYGRQNLENVCAYFLIIHV